jgi:hypothetical protein
MAASTSSEINAAFATMARERCDALFVGQDGFFNARRVQLTHLGSRHALPAIYGGRDFAARRADELRKQHHGFLSSGRCLRRSHSQGRKTCRPAGHAGIEIRAGINAETARTLGLDVPPSLLALADEVIE